MSWVYVICVVFNWFLFYGWEPYSLTDRRHVFLGWKCTARILLDLSPQIQHSISPRQVIGPR